MRTAAETMLTIPATHPPTATVGEIPDFFRDDHVHAALIVNPAGYLEAVVEREDLAAAGSTSLGRPRRLASHCDHFGPAVAGGRWTAISGGVAA